jgi:hypothetical protein
VTQPPAVEGALAPGLRLITQLEQTGVLTDTGLNLDGLDITYDECEALAAMCGRVREVSTWVIGDLIVYSEQAFGDDVTYGQLAHATGLAYQSVVNIASVSRRVPPHRRRRGLSRSHHEAVAKLPPGEQRTLLAKAEREDWSRDILRDEVRAATHPEPTAAVSVEPNPDAVIDAARTLIRNARDAGENTVCRKEDVESLRLALVDDG